jgi:hypothetical protein
MKREYALITRASVFWGSIGILIVYMVIGLTPTIMLVSENKLGQSALGPCFYCRNCNSPEKAGKYSGYSTIVDTVWTNKDYSNLENKPQTMMVNGKEYILK